MSTIQIIVGSMLGTTEYVGEACEEQLIKFGHQVNLYLKPNFANILAKTNNFTVKNKQKNIWLICTSTHGAGDYPDNIIQFIKDLSHCEQDLSSIDFMIIAVGDSSYDTFCKAGSELNKLLLTKGCNKLTVIKTLDMSQNIDPEALAQHWLVENKKLFL